MTTWNVVNRREIQLQSCLQDLLPKAGGNKHLLEVNICVKRRPEKEEPCAHDTIGLRNKLTNAPRNSELRSILSIMRTLSQNKQRIRLSKQNC